MKNYVDKDKLQEYTTKLTAKNKTIFATKAEVGSPLVASTVAEMTDENKIYVYVGSETGYTSGNWYYYNGSAWTSGGVYNSQGFVLDDTLTDAAKPAQAKAVGDAIGDLRNEFEEVSEKSPNLLPYDETAQATVNDVLIKYSQGHFTLSGTGSANGGRTIHVLDLTLPAGTYTIKRFVDSGSSPYVNLDSSTRYGITQQGVTFTLSNETEIFISFNVVNEHVYNEDLTFSLVSGSTAPDTFIEPYFSAIDVIARNFVNEKWKNKTWVCVGDSLTEENSATTKHYFDYVADTTGIKTVNMGEGGTGYYKLKRDNDNNIIPRTTFYERIEDDLANSGIDVVTIFGSGNDLNPEDGSGRTWTEILGNPTDVLTDFPEGTPPTVCAYINAAIDAVYTKMPLVRLGIVLPTPWKLAWNDTEGRLANADDTQNILRKWYTYTEAIKTICGNRGIPYLDLFRESTLRPWDASYRELCYSKDIGQDGNPDGTHPDETGHAIIAMLFKDFLEKIMRID